MQALIRELTRLERPALEAHFLALGASERRLRFGVPLSDSAVRTYVERIDFERDAVFGVSGEDLRLVGVGHVGRGDGHAELGISVLESERGRGTAGRCSRALTCERATGACARFSCTASRKTPP